MTTNRPLNSGASVGVGGIGVTVGAGWQLADSISTRMTSQLIFFIMFLLAQCLLPEPTTPTAHRASSANAWDA